MKPARDRLDARAFRAIAAARSPVKRSEREGLAVWLATMGLLVFVVGCVFGLGLLFVRWLFG